MTTELAEIAARPMRALHEIRERYPDAWVSAEGFRSLRGRQGIPRWPDWCYLPLHGTYAIATRGADDTPPSDTVGLDVAILGALAPWRLTRGVYLYDDTLLDALWDTPVAGELPGEVLEHLPEWCVYVATPTRDLPGEAAQLGAMHGFFAHLDWDTRGYSELRLLVDLESPRGPWLWPIPIHLGHGGLVGGLEAMRAEANRSMREHGISPDQAITEHYSRLAVEAAEPLVSVLLYLCVKASEVVARDGGTPHPRRPPRKVPSEPVLWDVGARLGAAIRDYVRGPQEPAGPGGGTHASPRPHVRRAHWHTYLMGPRSGTQRRVLKWLPPVPVNVGDEDLPATIRRVE